MQPTLVKQITTTGSLPGKVTPLGIKQEDMAHIMGILTRQYSDTAMAVLREYAANARDEHVFTGQADRPIEVTLPNRFDPFLVIKDYGRGMSSEFVEERYSQYGDSTKRTPDGKDIGGFGIGGKAALSYTDSFIVKTVHNGLRSEFVISRDAGGAGSIKTLMADIATNSENFTEIRVPAIGIDDFTSKAEHLFKFWPEGSVLVNGEAPRRHTGKTVTDTIFYSEYSDGQSYLVMGGIPYRVAHAQRYLASPIISRFHFIADVPVNAADITPSREDLEYTDKTIACLKKVGEEFAAGFLAMIQADIDAQENHALAFDKRAEWVTKTGSDDVYALTYKGEVIPTHATVNALRWNIGRGRRSSYYYYDEKPTAEVEKMTIPEARQAIFITGRKDNSSYTKSRVRLYMNTQSKYHNNIYFVEDLVKNKWVGEWKKISWKEVLSVKPANYSRGGETKFTVVTDNGYTDALTVDELKEKKNVVVVTPARWKEVKAYQSNIMTYTKALDAEMTLVKLPENRHKAFTKKLGTILPLDEFIKDLVTEKRNDVSEVGWKKSSLDSDSNLILRRLNAKGLTVADPIINEMVKLTDSAVDEEVKKIGYLHNLSHWFGVKFEKDDRGDYIAKTYPLINHMYVYNTPIDELVIYLDAAYAARKDKN